ncbi:hypothetical protein TRFO_36009 [Tritrichomonas foetus]|uniref:IPO4/5-like TPR repeats domain-containing protein n=1 Tax=Tritrichomonas foetus TaxID=1144522 RepID=A0A1J4JGD5_9EUKA|nr:hypothetical protein TRFO_36009 [Tritrichomonas foetus]|eukprot:OHS97721.1 hypothetical protein TRFO_36009 [Tritrichomonas foetus]
MDTPLYHYYHQFIQPLDSNLINQTSAEILKEYEKQESVFQIVSILTTPDLFPIVRSHAAIGLSKVIQNHLEFLLSNPQGQSLLNSFIQILANETTPIIYRNIIFALDPVFEKVKESWTELTSFMMNLLNSSDSNHIKIGLKLITQFLPYASNQFLAQILPAVAGFIESALTSDDEDIQISGIELFSSLVSTEIPVQQVAAEYAEILQRIFQIFHNLLVNCSNNCSSAADYISRILKSEPLFVPATVSYHALIQILSDNSISPEYTHYPLFPINKLIKNYGSELEQFFQPSIPLFLAISASKFDDVGFEHLIDATSIVPLIKNMCLIASDSDQFINLVFQNISSTNDIPSSYASICALLGIVDSECDQIECHISKFVQYAIGKIQLQNFTLIQECFKLFVELIQSQPDSMLPYAQDICNFAFQLYNVQANEDLVKCSLDLIVTIFFSLELEASFVVSTLPSILQAYNQTTTTLKPYFMNCIAAAISSCREESIVFADSVLPIIMQGSQEESEAEVDNRGSCIEALGNLLTFVPEKCQGIYENAVKLLLSLTSNEILSLRAISLKSLINIIKFSDGKLPMDFTPFAAQAAACAINQRVIEGEINIEDDSSYTVEDIIVDGFKLLKHLMKWFPHSCQQLVNSLPELFTKSITNSTVRIQEIAIISVSRFIIAYNPEQTDVYDNLFKIITESHEESLIIASFNAYKKIMHNSSNNLAIPNFARFVEAGLACLAHQLPFQDGSFDYNKPVSKMLVTFFEHMIYDQSTAFPAQKFLETCNAIIPKITDKESFSVLEIISAYVEVGGTISPEIVQFGLTKMQLCDFSHSHEPIAFIRAIIKNQPQVIAPLIGNILEFCKQRLAEDVAPTIYYWPTITNIVSTILAVVISPLSGNQIQPEQFMAVILSKLPVKGDYVEAQFIYRAILNLIQTKRQQMMQFIPEIFRVFVQTLALKNSSFERLDLDNDVVQMIANSVKAILSMQPQFQEKVPGILENDQLKIQRLQQRLSSI